MAWDVFHKNKWRCLIGTLAFLALSGCGKDDDVATVTKDIKLCRDGDGKPALAEGIIRGLHIICWPKER